MTRRVWACAALVGCYYLTPAEVRERTADGDVADTDADTDSDADADADSDTDADTDADADTGIGEVELPTEDTETSCVPAVLGDGDHDLWVVSGASAFEKLWIWTVAERLPTPSGVDTTLDLLDGDGAVVRTALDLPFALSTDSALLLNSDGDDVQVVVSGVGTGEYELCAAITQYTEGDIGGGPPNDLRDGYGVVQSTVWPVDDRLLVADAEISGANDVDALPFAVLAGHTYRAALMEGHVLVSPELRLYADGDNVVRGEAIGAAADYDPAPAAQGWPPDAALQWYAPADGVWYIEVDADWQEDPAQDFYHLLVEDMGGAFVAEGAPRFVPTEDGGRWTARVTGDALGSADTIVVALDTPASLEALGGDVKVSAWVQARSVGGPGVVDLTIRDPETGFVLLQVPPETTLSGDPLVEGYDLTPEPFGAEVTFKIGLQAYAPGPWFLTVVLEL